MTLSRTFFLQELILKIFIAPSWKICGGLCTRSFVDLRNMIKNPGPVVDRTP